MNRPGKVKYIILSSVVLLLIAIVMIVALAGNSGENHDEMILPTENDLITGLHEGMAKSEFDALIPKEERFDFMGYSFLENSSGDSVLVYCDYKTKTVDEVFYYSQKNQDRSAASFEQIKEGMTIYEVVSRVGNPTSSITSGMTSTLFKASDGTTFNVYWTQSEYENIHSMVVSNVVRMEE